MSDLVLHCDFETFSEANLKLCGVYRYAIDPTTEILVCCWAVGEEEVNTWVPCITLEEARRFGLPTRDYVDNGRKMPTWHYGPTCPAPLAAAVASGITFAAHNAQFERAIWQAIVVKRHGGPRTKPQQFVCTAARSAASGLPRSLDGVGMALGTQHQKDTEGAKLLKMFAMVRKPTKHDSRKRIIPLDAPGEFKRLVQYCQQDVRTERDVDKEVPHLHPLEQKLFAFDMQINERGLYIDIPLVQKTSRVVARLESDIVAEVKKLTVTPEYPQGLRPTQRDKMMGFFQSIGVELENMQADHVRKYMKKNAARLKDTARRLLMLRMEAGKASTKKLASMMAFCGPDQRARGTLLFYGAHTGRWSGKGIQPHNFIRGTLKHPEQLRIFDLLEHDDHEIFEMLYEWPITAISSCMRGFIRAKPGHILRVVDYSSIEARVLAWMALEEEVLQAYREGLDVYRVMASKLYSVPYDQVSDEQRRIGKNLVLGCFGEDTEVLTERGWVRIVDVRDTDRAWDGVEWVEHEGVKWQGRQEVINLRGVLVTPDHPIWNGSQWRAASDIAEDSHSLRSANESVSLPSEHSLLDQPADRVAWNVSAVAETPYTQGSTTSLLVGQPRAMPAQSKRQRAGWQQGPTTPEGSTSILKSDRPTAPTRSLKSFLSVVHAGLRLAQSAARSALDRATSFITALPSRTVMTVGAFLSIGQILKLNGCTRNGITCSVASSTNHMGAVRSKSLTTGGSRCSVSLRMQSNSQGTGAGLTSFKSIGSTTSAGTALGTADSARNERISQTKSQTYDIMNCGPRSQYVIRTHSGPLLVHNCGYGLGGAKFVQYSEKAGVEITEEFAKAAVRAYRNGHRNIVRFWGDVERCSIQAVRTSATRERPIVLRNLRFFVEGQWFCIQLPSGRCLRYYRPKVVPVEKFGEPALQLQFKTEFHGRLVTESTYGGKLVENIVQAVARDILVNGMFEAESEGYTVIGTVHDEILTEVPVSHGSVHALEKIVCRLPQWAHGLPIGAEGFESYRYRKG